MAELDVRPGEQVQDIGTARDASLISRAPATGPSGRVLGIDLAPRMMALTAQDVLHLPQEQVRVGDATAPGLHCPSTSSLLRSCCSSWQIRSPVC